MQKHNYLNFAKEMVFDGKDKDFIEQKINQSIILNKEEKIALTSHINDFHVEYELMNQEISNHKIQFAIGIILLSLGLIISIFTFLSSSSSFILCFGLIIGGAYLSWKKYLAIKNPKDTKLKPRTKKFKGKFHK